jgi:BMFP domain-containing protein YqiC
MEGTAPAETTTVERPRMNDAEHEWVNIRSRFEQTSRDRMAKLDARIQELEQSASESAHMTAQELRRDRDELAMRIEQVRDQTKPAWDEFQADVEQSFQRLEKRLDDAVH